MSSAKSTLTAWERWELASLSEAAPPPAEEAEPATPLVDPAEVEQIREAARREGYDAGYAAGETAGRIDGQAKAEALGREQAELLARATANLEQRLSELNHEVSNELLALSLEVARQVIRHTIEVKPELLLGVIREALAQLPLLHTVIHLNPEDASLIRSYAGDQLTHAGHRIHEDPKLERGDVILDAGGSHLDASVAMRWRRVLETLGQDIPWSDAGT